jgi:hydrogenase nickel incorporation protein HypA/HybF
MHEMSLAASLVDLIQQHARESGLAEVKRVFLRLGAHAAVDESALAFGFEVARRGTVAAEAELCFERVPGRAYCMDCAETVDLAARGDPCPSCGMHQLLLVAGEEMSLTALEGN